jgi:hypothetical protein
MQQFTVKQFTVKQFTVKQRIFQAEQQSRVGWDCVCIFVIR